MSEPLSREELENRPCRYRISYHLFADTALHYLDRVAELEEALEYYAKRNHYDDDILNDDGAVARAALLRVRESRT